MQPGLCVMQKSGRVAITTDCGVTPQAQKTGSSDCVQYCVQICLSAAGE